MVVLYRDVVVSGAETHDDGSLTLARLSDGTLFSQQKVSGGNTTGKRYCGSFVFTTGTGITTPQVECVAWDEGRILADAAGYYHDCWFAGDHLGNIRSVLDITPDVTVPIPLEQNDYLPFGTKISNPLHAQMNTNRWRYAGKEEFPDLNLLDFGARMYDPFMARWTAVDPLAEKYTSMSPYMYCAGDPVCVYDPNGRMANPIYTSDGTYKGTTIEGFTGAVIIYNGDKEFSKITALELLNDEGAHTYDQVRDALSGEVKAKIWTHLVSQMDGLQVYDETFSLTTLSDGKIGFSSTANGSWNSNLNLKTITGTDKYNYETTVENILSSIIVHEWYSHIMKGNRDAFESHRLAYKNVINYKPFWEGSTDAYKGFNLRELLLYTKKETGRTKVDPLYRRLYKRYNEVY